jgi:hypothetical protein
MADGDTGWDDEKKDNETDQNAAEHIEHVYLPTLDITPR